jgi:hypothetical protein
MSSAERATCRDFPAERAALSGQQLGRDPLGAAGLPRCAIWRHGSSARRGEQVALVPQAPAARPGGRGRHLVPVVDEAVVPGGGGLGDDRVGPVVIGDYGLGYLTALGPG